MKIVCINIVSEKLLRQERSSVGYIWARQSACTQASHRLTDPKLGKGSVSLWACLERGKDCRAHTLTNLVPLALVHRERSSYHCFIFPPRMGPYGQHLSRYFVITQINAE